MTDFTVEVVFADRVVKTVRLKGKHLKKEEPFNKNKHKLVARLPTPCHVVEKNPTICIRIGGTVYCL